MDKPVIDEFSVSKDSLQAGESTIIHWRVHSAQEVSIRGVGAGLPSQGSRTVTPSLTKSYLLEATGKGGSVQQTLTVSVTASLRPPSPIIETFTASLLSINSGDSSVLQWNVTGASAVTISELGTILPGQTTRMVCPTQSKSYVLSASGPGGSVSRSVNIEVRIPPGENVRLNHFSADPLSVNSGEVSVLRWQVANASKVWIDPSIGAVDACGVLKVQPRETTKYQLSYQNDRGTMRSRPVTVTVH